MAIIRKEISMEDKRYFKSGEHCSKCNIDCLFPHAHCPKCDSPPSKHRMTDYDPMWHEANIYCNECNAYVRHYDAG